VAAVAASVHASADHPERRSPGSRAQRFLAEAGEVLAASLNYDATLSSIASLAVPAIADWCSVILVGDRASDKRIASAHVDPELAPVVEGLDWNLAVVFPSNNGQADPSRTSRPSLFVDVSDEQLGQLLPDNLQRAQGRRLETRSLIVAPLHIRSRQIGAILLATAGSDRRYAEADLAMVEDLARRAAVAIDNARLYHEAREAEARIRQQAERLEALAEASNAFAMARLDLDAVLNTVTRRVADLIGDVCSIRLLSEDGNTLVPVAFHHTIPAAYDVFKTLPSFGSRGVHEGTVGQVMLTGQPLLVANRSVEDWRPMVLPDWIPYIERFGMHSILIVPLRAGGTTIGTLGLWREATPEPFTLDDQQFVQDLADRAGLAVDNARLYAHAQDAIAARDEFLSVAAHELKTPVTSLRGYAQLLLRQLNRGNEIPPERLRGALASIDRQTWRLSALISQLLDTSRIHSGELSVQKSLTDIVDLVAELVEHARTLSDEHEIVVDVQDPLVAEIDSLRIEQVLTNLLENAIKFSPAGGMIRINAYESDSGWLRIAVQDSGPGVPETERERIFERFYQIDNAGNANGMGLGLYISRQIVTLHGGTIAVEAPSSGGTRFVIQLPVAR
jgi:signal transduction histidine kinase